MKKRLSLPTNEELRQAFSENDSEKERPKPMRLRVSWSSMPPSLYEYETSAGLHFEEEQENSVAVTDVVAEEVR